MGRTFGVELDNISQMNSLFANKCSFRLTETIHRLRLNSANSARKGTLFFLTNHKSSILTFQQETFKSFT